MSLSQNRKKRGIGGTLGIDQTVPGLDAARASIVNIERLLYALVKSEVERFRANEDDLRIFFSHYFDALVGEAAREEFIANFIRQPPTVINGYARTSTDFPCIAIVLESEDEGEQYLGDFMGESTDEEDDDDWREYEGAKWEGNYGLWVYAQHPDVCLYLYQFAKMVLMSGRRLLVSQGIPVSSLSGGELAPDSQYLPDQMFVRMVRIRCESMQTVPRFASVDPRRTRTYGLFMEDVVVDGVQGGVTPRSDFDGEQEDGEEDDLG